MPDPLSTLLQLNAITMSCDEVQAWIDSSRAMFPNDQEFQLELDRRQTEVDEKRMTIRLLMLDIRMRN